MPDEVFLLQILLIGGLLQRRYFGQVAQAAGLDLGRLLSLLRVQLILLGHLVYGFFNCGRIDFFLSLQGREGEYGKE